MAFQGCGCDRTDPRERDGCRPVGRILSGRARHPVPVPCGRATDGVFDCDGVRLYLGVPESPEFRSNPLLYFVVQDLDEAYSALPERGVQFRDSPHLVHRAGTSELWMTFFTDPDGNNLALMADKPVQSAG